MSPRFEPRLVGLRAKARIAPPKNKNADSKFKSEATKPQLFKKVRLQNCKKNRNLSNCNIANSNCVVWSINKYCWSMSDFLLNIRAQQHQNHKNLIWDASSYILWPWIWIFGTQLSKKIFFDRPVAVLNRFFVLRACFPVWSLFCQAQACFDVLQS